MDYGNGSAAGPRRVDDGNDDGEVVLFVGFNQDASCVSVGTSSSFRVFALDPFTKRDECWGVGVRHVELLFSSALVALVGSSDDPSFSPRRLRLLNTNTKKRVGELSFTSSILNVKLHEQRLLAVTARQAHVFELPTLKLLASLETPTNAHGVCDLSSSSSSRCFAALPASDKRGDVLLYDCLRLHSSAKVHAHANPLRLLVFNAAGTMLCTASSKGTVLRVFSVPTGERLFSFRRGLQLQTPYSAGFSPSSSLLCFASDSDTVHVFSLSAASSARLTDLLPSALTEMVEPTRSVARIRLKDHCGPAQCRFLDDDRIALVTERDFHVRIYDIVRSSPAAAAVSESCEPVEYCCRLVSEHALVRSPQQAIGASLFQHNKE